MSHNFSNFAIIAASVLLLAACENAVPKKKIEPPVEERGTAATQPAPEAGASTKSLEKGPTFTGNPLDNPDSLLSRRIVYFDFDKSDIHPEDRPVIEAHARYLSEHPNAVVVLEGHTDERGTREYNIGLGQRRATAVRRLLSLLGASDGQLRTVSFGEERPVALGHDEAAWQQNRRVEFNYLSR